MTENTDKLVDFLVRHVAQSASDKQLDLFSFPDPEDDANKKLEIYNKELDRLLAKRQRYGSQLPSVTEILSSFRLMHPVSQHDYLRDAGIESNPDKAIRSDWQNVFEDFCLAFLKEAQAIENRRARRQ